MISGAGRWVLLLALAAGLIGMHHLEAGEMPPAAGSVAGAVTAVHGRGGGADAHPVAVEAPGGPQAGPAGGTAMDMAMHLCLAILAAVALLGALALVLVMVRPLRPPAGAPRAVVLTAARPPPRSAVRLALLCVLRN